MQLKRVPLVQLLLGCACALALLPNLAYATDADAPLGSDFAAIVAQAQSEDESDPFAPEEGYTLQTQADKPSCLDLRHVLVDGVEKCYVTPVRQQNPFGSCWGFGAIAAAETSLLSSGLATDPLTLNLSEKQVVWFNAVALDDPNSPQDGEGMTFGSDFGASKRYNAGGLTSYATSLFASGVGPVSEATETNYGKIFYYSGLNGEVVNDEVTWLDENGVEQRGFRKVYYSEDDDWSIPEAYRFWQDYQLKESYLLPSPAECKTDEDLAAANDAIKEQLLSHHAVAINFRAQTSQPGQTTQFNDVLSENWAQYDSAGWPSNHVVTIIGYDDNYPKSNFATEPPGDGAWLVKNSWGSDLLEFPDNGYRHWGLLEGMDIPGSDYQATSKLHTGYFWLSYYDTTIRDPETYAFEAGDASIIIDQHDFMSVTDYEQYATEGHNRTANVFVASQDETLEEISFMTSTPGMVVSWRIYLLDDDATNPEDGTCVAFAEGQEYALGGYHRESLDEDSQVTLAEGQRYAIVVEQRAPSGKYSFTVNTSISKATSYNGSVWFEGIVNEGESFFYIDGAWRDLSDDSIRSMLKDDRVSIDNFSIKVYASAAEADPDQPVQPDPPEEEERAPYLEVRRSTGELATNFDLDQRETAKLKCTIKGATDDLETQPKIAWSVSDKSIITVEPNEEREGAEAVVTPHAYGESYLTIDAGIYGKCEILVTVPKLSILNAELADEDRVVVYTGQPHEPEPQNVYMSGEGYEHNYDVVRGTDYEVEYQNNVKCGRGEMIVRGIGDYGGEIATNMWRDLSFVILPTKSQITSVTSDTGHMTVQFASQKDSGISGYELTWKEAGAEQGQTMLLDADATSATIGGLKEGTTYEVSLRAYVTTINHDWDTDIDSEVDNYGESSDVQTCVVRAAEEGSATPDSSNANSGTHGSSSGTSNGQSVTVGKKSSSAKSTVLPRTADPAHSGVPFVLAGFGLVTCGSVVKRMRQRK